MKKPALEEATKEAKKAEKERLRELALNKLYDSDNGMLHTCALSIFFFSLSPLTVSTCIIYIGFALNSERPDGDKAVILIDQLATSLKEHQVRASLLA
jgi:hypothetical protein